VILDYYSISDDQGVLNDQIETELLTKFETWAKPVIDKMRQRASLSEDDRGAFATFVALMELRTPYARHKLERLALAVMQRRLTPIAADPERFQRETAELEASGEIPVGLNNEEFRLDMLRDLMDEDFHKRWSVNREFGLRLFQTTQVVAQHVFNMHWRIFSATEHLKYFTCDHPVTLARETESGKLIIGTGVGNPEAELTFPITKDLALIAGHGVDRNYHYVVGDEGVVNEVNRRTTVSAYRYVYAHMRSPELMKYNLEHGRVKPEYHFDSILAELD
jgi:hypothetical protein